MGGWEGAAVELFLDVGGFQGVVKKGGRMGCRGSFEKILLKRLVADLLVYQACHKRGRETKIVILIINQSAIHININM